MINVLKREVDTLADNNRQNLSNQYSEFVECLQHALSPTAPIDNFVYKPDHMLTYGMDFLAHIDPRFA